MNELSKYIVDQILLEEPTPIKKTVVVYVGRFQPFHKGHYATYSHLVKKFGKDNVYIGTSNKVEKPKSPFNFKEKKQIMATMFDVPSNKIFEVKNPYAPTEILKKFDEKNTAFITVVGEKDSGRLGGKYFKKWDGNPTEGYKERGYVYTAPAQPNPLSGTDVRIGLGSGTEEQKKNFFLDRAYTKFNKTIFSLITNKLEESCIKLNKTQIQDIILERVGAGDLSAGDFVGVDDGPNTFLPSFKAFNYINADRAKVLGWELIQKFLEDDFSGNWVFYPEGPVNSVSFFPAGVIGKTTSTNQVDIYVKGAYDAWYKHATRKATLMGWAVVDTALDTDDYYATQGSEGDVKLEKEYNKQKFVNHLEEVITLPVEIGDTLLMGKFKNKKVVVKTIGKDEHGMPTINGKKVVTFRLMKEGYVVELSGTEIQCEVCNHGWEIKQEDEHPYLCHNCGWDSQQQEYDFDEFDEWKDENNIDEALTQAQRAARRWTFQKNKKLINIKKQRTAIRKKPYSVLAKRAHKLAYLYVRNEWSERLFGTKKYDELSLPQKQRVSQMVQKRKRKILKLAKFRFLPALKQKEADRFKTTNQYPANLTYNEPTNENIFVDESVKETINESIVNDVFLQILKIIGTALASGLVAGLAYILRAIGGYVVDVLLNGISNYAKNVKNLVSPDSFTKFTTELSKNKQFNKQFLNVLIKHGGLKNTNVIAFLNDIENTKEFNDILYKYYPKEKFKTNERNQAVREFRNGIGNTLKDKGGWLVKTIKKKFPELKGVQVESILSEIPMDDLQQIDKFADKQLNPVDVVITHKHFMDRLVDPRNKKPISAAELTGFFKRLAKQKDKFVEFLKKYGEIVAKDNRTKINIAFMKQANKAIAKTIMRKDDFKTPSPELKFENLNEGMYDPKNIKAYYEALCKAEGIKPLPVKFQRVGKGGAATTYNSKTMKPLYISFDVSRLSDPEFAIVHELTHQIKLETEGDAYLGKRDQLAKFKKLENHLIDKYVYSKYSKLLYELKFEKMNKTKNSFLALELAPHGYPDQEWMNKHEKKMKKLRNQLDKQHKDTYK